MAARFWCAAAGAAQPKLYSMLRPLVAVIVLVLAGLATNVAAPAWACGCGAYIPDQPGPAVVDERALIAWNGTTEDILMSFGVRGSSDKAAWIMPVPSAAEVTLGDGAAFDELARLTAPRIEYRDSWWPSFKWLAMGAGPVTDAAAPGGGVSVLDQQRIGPFDVTRLAADDPAALAGWLAGHGFPHPPGLDQNLAPYLADRWEIVAVQLAADTPDDALTGTLQPLRLTFASERAVYPMRLSRSASTPQSVDLYVLADHRMDPSAVPVAGNTPTLRFAGALAPAQVSPALAPFVGDGAFLTRWSNQIDDPVAITGDYAFAPAAADTEYRQVIYRERDRGNVTGAALLIAIPTVFIAATIGITLWRVRRQAR